ncbi:acyl-CoA dehydrogenase family protein [Pseudomonas citronellolis]|uniref:acyl-CoA dehydrogenase family protein n=1 Tax=Pseudomonas citronellolis TaxID=53408 RepID=UPI0021C22309|nr:acyl-CoA dehydrogenase family protein [Pseudomonas citronellolis]UXJ50192.1 acyl-CoA dehydrogenase family protein [Pseudomonas citronellolis]
MHFEFSQEDEAFRQEVRQFFRESVTPEIAHYGFEGAHPVPRDVLRKWQKALHARGWGAPHWPKEFGGTDWSAIRKHIFLEELVNADGLDYGWQGTHMMAPVVIAFGNKWQQETFLPPLLSGDVFWCQGFSEPNSGSDLASLKTRAELDEAGTHYIVNGQKIWTSDAKIADWGFFLVRTDPTVKPQRGISFLLIDMKSPGITVRPIVSIDGGDGLAEVFLENVRVPKENLVGEPGMGWTYAKYLLEKERTSSAFIYFNKRELEKAKAIARAETVDGVPLLETPAFARRVAEIEADILALEWSVLRILAQESFRDNLDAVVSTLKVRGSELQQRVTELQVDALGPRSLRFYDHGPGRLGHEHQTGEWDDLWPSYVPGRSNMYFFQRASTIYGGAREVQKNIIAKLAFGL